MTRLVLNVVGFQLVWLACALGAGQGLAWPGIAAAMAVIAANMALSTDRQGLLLALVASGVCGLVFENILASAGLLRYSALQPQAGLAPLWIIGLWVVFGTTLDAILRLLGPYPALKSGALGVAIGPLSYWGGVRMGALEFPSPVWPSVAALALVWAIAMPVLLTLQRRLNGR